MNTLTKTQQRSLDKLTDWLSWHQPSKKSRVYLNTTYVPASLKSRCRPGTLTDKDLRNVVHALLGAKVPPHPGLKATR